MNTEERARLREHIADERRSVTVTTDTLRALLDEVDRLTEALEATRPCGCGSMSRDATNDFRAVAAEAVEMRHRAERAEADLADEKRRRADAWDEGYNAAAWRSFRATDVSIGRADEANPPNPYRALLDTAIEETPS